LRRRGTWGHSFSATTTHSSRFSTWVRVIGELPWAYAVLGVVLIGSLWIERFFCKNACPLGAVLGLLAKVGLTKVRRDAADCKERNLCYKKCHAHVDFLSVNTIRDAVQKYRDGKR
jgi:polyferredoxin